MPVHMSSTVIMCVPPAQEVTGLPPHQPGFSYRCLGLKLRSSPLCHTLLPSQLLNILLNPFYLNQFSMNDIILHLKIMSEWINLATFFFFRDLAFGRMHVYHCFLEVEYPLICLRQLISFLCLMTHLRHCWVFEDLFPYQRGGYSVTSIASVVSELLICICILSLHVVYFRIWDCFVVELLYILFLLDI